MASWVRWSILIGWLMAIAPAAALADARGARPAQAGPMVMSTRGFSRTSVLNNSTGQEAITAYRFEIPYGLSAGWRLPYLGFSEGPTGIIQINGVSVEVDQPGQPARRAAVTFAGQAGATVAPNAVVESDPVGIPAAPASVVIVWTYYRNEDPQGPLPFMTWGYAHRCDGYLAGAIGRLSAASLGDDSLVTTDSSAPPLNAGVPLLFRSYEPMFISGRPSPRFKGAALCVGFIGDSINIATGDFGPAAPGDPYPARGWNGRACAAGTPYVVFGQSGSNAVGFIGAQGTDLFKYVFGTGAAAGDARVNLLVDAYGINNIRNQSKGKSMDVVWQDRLTVAGIARSLGLPYVQTTLTPMDAGELMFDPSMGDKDSRFAVFISDRKTFNDKVRTLSRTIPGCVGTIDWGASVETDPVASNDLWQPEITLDGIHPNTAGHQRMSVVAAKVLAELRGCMRRGPLTGAGAVICSGIDADAGVALR